MSTTALEFATAPAGRLPVDLDRILRETSRSIYITLRLVPREVRRPLMLAYLFCRAADTIADTRVLPPGRRVEMLALFRRQFEVSTPDPEALGVLGGLAGDAHGVGFTASERALIANLSGCFAVHAGLDPGDRALLRRLLTTLTLGMQIDLESFPAEELAESGGAVRALPTDDDLDRYCYHVAGCVGEFWTDLQTSHLPALRSLDTPRLRKLGVRFGKGLQMTNVLRDLPDDLLAGRCYLPLVRLESAAIEPETLRRCVVGELGDRERADLVRRLTPIYDALLDLTLEHYRSGWEYTLSLPRRLPRSRLACALPLLIGLETLALLRSGVGEVLAGKRLKIPRKRVYRLLGSALVRVGSNTSLRRLRDGLERAARRAVSRPC